MIENDLETFRKSLDQQALYKVNNENYKQVLPVSMTPSDLRELQALSEEALTTRATKLQGGRIILS